MARPQVPQRLRRWYKLWRPRSRGVPVSRPVLRRLWAANDARDAADWRGAAADYAVVLAEAPHLAHIWVQYGHMLREAGRPDEARDAYERAIALDPRERESYRMLIRLARTRGDRADATRHALALFRLDPDDASARQTLLQALSADEGDHPPLIAEAAAAAGMAVPAAPSQATHDPALFFDVSDLVVHLTQSRFPSGLQRVEIEVTRAALAAPEAAVRLCCWSAAAAGWKPLRAETFIALVEAAASEMGAGRWNRLLDGTLLGLAVAPAIVFPPGSTLFNLGMAWGDPLYHSAVAREKARGELRFAAIACDVIPLVSPEQMPDDIVTACGDWLDALAEVADALVAISAATRDDVVMVSAARGKPIGAERIGVAPLDAAFAPVRRGGSDILARHGLEPGGYVLYVSTVEPRKNHLAAFEAWRRLAVNPARRLPHLVCVGRMGWLSKPVAEALASDRALASQVHMLQGISDAALDELYRHCAFVFYPSLHEGWGLPVTEALAYGKVPAIGRNSSLPEAGGPFAIYFDAASPADMARAVAPLIDDPATLAAREAAIRDGFRPRGWAAVAADMIAVATGVR